MKISNVLVQPLVTEKTTSLASQNKYVFKVTSKSSKGSISKAIKETFDVDVIDIQTLILPGKSRRVRGKKTYTKAPKWKKAIVRLKEGQSIQLTTTKG